MPVGGGSKSTLFVEFGERMRVPKEHFMFATRKSHVFRVLQDVFLNCFKHGQDMQSAGADGPC